MDNLTWDLTIKQNPSQTNKYIDNTLKGDSPRQPIEDLNLKQLNIDNSFISISNGETKVSKESSSQVLPDKGESRTKVKFMIILY